MSKQTVQLIIGRAVVDSQFRKELFGDADHALSQYSDLTEEEKKALKSIKEESVERFANELDERITKGQVSSW